MKFTALTLLALGAIVALTEAIEYGSGYTDSCDQGRATGSGANRLLLASRGCGRAAGISESEESGLSGQRSRNVGGGYTSDPCGGGTGGYGATDSDNVNIGQGRTTLAGITEGDALYYGEGRNRYDTSGVNTDYAGGSGSRRGWC